MAGLICALGMVSAHAAGPAVARALRAGTPGIGAAVQPEVKLNGERVGSAVPKGFFYVDRSPGDYEVTTTTELKKSLTFHLDAGQTRYVRLNISFGFMVGHVYPELVEESVGKTELEKTKSTTK